MVNIKVHKIPGILLILSSIFPFGFGIYSFFKTQSFLKEAVKTEGIILEFREEYSGDKTMYRAIFSFSDIDGKEYTIVSKMKSSPPAYSIGDSVIVVYSPKNPDKAKINSFLGVWMSSLILFVLGLIGFVIGLFLFFGIPMIIHNKQYIIEKTK